MAALVKVHADPVLVCPDEVPVVLVSLLPARALRTYLHMAEPVSETTAADRTPFATRCATHCACRCGIDLVDGVGKHRLELDLRLLADVVA